MRASSILDPELIKQFNAPEVIKDEQKKLKHNEKTKLIVGTKQAPNSKNTPSGKLAPKKIESEDISDTVYKKNDKLFIYAGYSQLKKHSSDDPSTRVGVAKEALEKGAKIREKRKKNELANKYKEEADKKYKEEFESPNPSPDKNPFVSADEEKYEIIIEEELTPKKSEMTLDDFRVIKLIDKGSFGEVYLTTNLIDNKKYAMKRIKKAILTEKSLKESTENEKQILLSLSHPFLLTMSYLFENEKKYYFFLEFIPGGKAVYST